MIARFFDIEPLPGETIATDGILGGSYQIESDNPSSTPHPAIMLVSAYIVERGLILEPVEVKSKSNEITTLPESIRHKSAQRGCICSVCEMADSVKGA